MESKQTRKTPLTTISISQDCAKKLDSYLIKINLSRRDFVELSVDYFRRTNFDIRGEAFDLSPIEKIADKLEASSYMLEKNRDGMELIYQMLTQIHNQTKKQLPSFDEFKELSENQIKKEVQLNIQNKELEQLREDNKKLQFHKEQLQEELLRIDSNQKTFGKIKIRKDLKDI